MAIETETNRRPRRFGCLLWSLLLVLLFTAALTAGVLILGRQQEALAGSGLSAGPVNANLSPWRRLMLQSYLADHLEELRRPAGTASSPQEFVINPGENAQTIAANLAAAGLIVNQELFLSYLAYYGLDSGLVAGAYRLDPQDTLPGLIGRISHNTSQLIGLNFLPGWRMEEMANYLAVTRPGRLSADDFMAITRRHNPIDLSRFDFLAALPPEASLEGFLFPDTYDVTPQTGSEQLVLMMLERFGKQITPAMRQAFGAQGLTLREAVILASIIEREAVIAEEKPVMAGVFLNRLRAGMPLQADPTVQYALGYQPDRETWWKVPLSADDLAIDSPYNTYLVGALPPGPISNPGLDSLQAVAQPAQTDYLYFVLDCLAGETGRHVFSAAYEDHVANVANCR